MALTDTVIAIVRAASSTGIATKAWALLSIAAVMPPVMAMPISETIAKSLATTKIY